MIVGTRVDYWRNTLVDRAFMHGHELAAVAGQHGLCQLWNPAASGILAIVNSIRVFVLTTSRVSLVGHNAALANTVPSSSKFLQTAGATLCTMELRYETNAAMPGNFVYADYHLGAVQSMEFLDTDPIVIEPGRGVIVRCHVQNLLMDAKFEWIEV